MPKKQMPDFRKILTVVVGDRPQFIKTAVISRVLQKNWFFQWSYCSYRTTLWFKYVGVFLSGIRYFKAKLYQKVNSLRKIQGIEYIKIKWNSLYPKKSESCCGRFNAMKNINEIMSKWRSCWCWIWARVLRRSHFFWGLTMVRFISIGRIIRRKAWMVI